MAEAPIAGRFELVQRIGRGATGEVWSAIDAASGGEVAVKLARGTIVNDPELAARFEREAKLLKRLKSPFVCALVDAGRTADGVPFLALERLTGETLEERLAREGFLAWDEATRIADQILQSLVVAHGAGVVHRDLSPANVILHRRADGVEIAKVLDFGVAKAADPNAPRTGSRATIGSLPYVAPEQLGDGASAGPRADLYAVGTLLFRALSGRMPYGDAKGTALVVLKREADPPSIDEATGESWPAAMRAFLAKTTARAPAKRYASAEVALAALRAAARGKAPAITLPDKPPDRTPTLPLDEPGARRGR